MEVSAKQNTIACPHSLTLENGTRMLISGVEEVISATEKGVILKLKSYGMQISGEALRVEKLSPEEKLLILTGQINAINYSNGGKTCFLKKLFR